MRAKLTLYLALACQVYGKTPNGACDEGLPVVDLGYVRLRSLQLTSRIEQVPF